VSLNSSGLMPPTAASTAVSAASGVWLRRVLLAVAAFETLVGLIDLAVFVPDLNIINARLFIHPLFAIAALVLAARRYLRAAIVVLAAYILATLAIGEPALATIDSPVGLSLLAQQVIFGPLAVTAIALASLDKLLWLGAVFVALPSANLLLGMIPMLLFTIAVIISGRRPPNRPLSWCSQLDRQQAALSRHNLQARESAASSVGAGLMRSSAMVMRCPLYPQ
jgi:hypothetical protein